MPLAISGWNELIILVGNPPPAPEPPLAVGIILSAPTSVPWGTKFTATATVSNAGSILVNVLVVTVEWRPTQAFKNEIPRSTTLAIGELGPGLNTMVSWVRKADKEGIATLTMLLRDSTGDMVDQSSQEVTILK